MSGALRPGATDPATLRRPRRGPWAGWARRAVQRRLAHVRDGSLELVEAGRTQRFGTPGPGRPSVRLEVHDPAAFFDVAFGGQLGAAEAYRDGRWECDDLPGLVRLFLRNPDVFGQIDSGAVRLLAPLERWLHRMRRNTRRGSRRHIAAHYDLGNEFFSSFLDPSMTYSAGIFERPEASLEEASVAKYERICRKLQLGSGMRVLEIGTGWGGFALHAAREHGVRVTTTTISAEQARLARHRVAEAGLDDRIEVLLEDYRDLRGRFDRVASIEMIEAVGHRYLGRYFDVCSRVLAPDGLLCIQAIVTPDQRYAESRRTTDVIKKHIFPGGQLPSLEAMLGACRRMTDLRLVHLEELSPHYSETLRRWRQRFIENLDSVRRLGYPREFLRLWEFYLAACEGGFAERYIGSVQLVWSKPQSRHEPLLGAL